MHINKNLFNFCIFFLLGFLSVINPLLLNNSSLPFFLLFLKLFLSIYFIVKVRLKEFDFESLLIFLGILLIGVHSFLFSFYPAVSIIKITLHFLVFLGFYACFINVKSKDLLPAIKALTIIFLVLSIIVLPFPVIGYARDGMGFQGITAHPQLFGILSGLSLLVFLDAILSSRNKLRFFYILCFLIMASLLLLSRARTGIVVFFIPVFLALLSGRIALLNKGILFFILIFAFVITGLFTSGLIDFSLFVDFFYKGKNSNVSEAFESSRGFLLAESLYNLQQNPFTGLGFGVADSSFKPFIPVYEPFTGIPISAPTEKANIFIGLLEELGYFLGIFILITHFLLLRKILKCSSRLFLLISIGCYISGISEFVFYSTNSLGYLYSLVLVVAIRTSQNDSLSVHQ